MANEKRLIDANALMDAFRAYMVERYDREKCVSEENCKTCESSCLWRKIVSFAPTVDAVEVVPCDECRLHLKCPTEERFRLAKVKNPYCCLGERREGE